MATVTYNTENLIAGNLITDQAPLAADTYYRGMPLTYNSSSHVYEYDAAPAVTDTVAVYLGNGIGATRVLSAPGVDTIAIAGSELMEGGLVTDVNAAYTVTEDLRAIFAESGIIIKRK